MPWITSAAVLAEAGAPDPMALGFNDQTAMTDHITNYLVPAAKSLIEEHLHRTYTDAELPDAVKHTAMRVCAQALMKISIRKMGALIRVGDYKVELSRSDIFTSELREELIPFIKKRTPGVRATPYQTDEIKERWEED
jgi:hypothetical protein